jgi:hypothetical protein
MNNYITTVSKFQGEIPKDRNFLFESFTMCNNVVDVVRMTHKPKSHIKKLSKEFYEYQGDVKLTSKYFINQESGEVEKMPTIDGNQMRNRRSLRVIFKDLRQLITTNFEGSENETFLTLTYQEQTNDPAKIYKDLDRFNKRLRWAIPDVGYIHIVEPHASGCWHVHSLIKHEQNPKGISMTYETFYELWGQGYVTVEDLNNVDNIGAYFIAYFSNMEIAEKDLHKYEDDIKEMPRADSTGVKKVIKGKRMDFYPDYMKIYRNSKNLKQPKKIQAVPEGFKKTYETTCKISTPLTVGTADTYIRKEQHKKIVTP